MMMSMTTRNLRYHHVSCSHRIMTFTSLRTAGELTPGRGGGPPSIQEHACSVETCPSGHAKKYDPFAAAHVFLRRPARDMLPTSVLVRRSQNFLVVSQ